MTASLSTSTSPPPSPWPSRLLLTLCIAVVGLELPLQVDLEHGLGGRLLLSVLGPAQSYYLPVRGWLLLHPRLAVAAAFIALALVALGYRFVLLLWHNQLKPRLNGTHLASEALGFPERMVILLDEVPRRPQGQTFIGLTPKKRSLLPGHRWAQLTLTAKQRSMHTHVLGKTGSGKTSSVIFPLVLQDALDGKGIVVIDAKGSDENIRTMKAICALAGRQGDLRVLALPAWNEPELFSHTYNMVGVRGDVAAMAERVFACLPMGDNTYYNTQAKLLFTNLCKLLHGMLGKDGRPLPFAMKDLAVCLKGLGVSVAEAALHADKPSAELGPGLALEKCLRESKDQRASREIEAQVARLGADMKLCFSGLIGAVDCFQSPLVNAYAPDIVFEEVLEKGLIVYIQLPSNLFKVQAPVLGKVMLMDIQQEGSLRQVHRRSRSQKPFSVLVDEFYDFADLSIVSSLNKLRDANLQYTLAHQSIADLELVSKEFAQAVWDNARTKLILNQNNPALCELVSKSLGTEQRVQLTVRREEGPLMTSLKTGDASSRPVEAFRLHPNAIKALAEAGQAYVYFGKEILPVCLAQFPELGADYELKRKEQREEEGLNLEAFIADLENKSGK